MSSDFWDKIKAVFVKIRATIGDPFLHIVLVGIIFLIFIASFQISVKRVEKDSDPWIKLLDSTEVPGKGVCSGLLVRLDAQLEANPKEKVKMESLKKTELMTAQCERLIEQMRYIKTRINLHSRLMQYLYTRMFAALITALGAGLLAMIVLVFVTREGWKDASSYLLVTFLSLSSVAGFYGAFPTMFEQKINAEANKDLILAYDTILQDINDHFVTTLDEKGKPADIQSFIFSVSKRITKLRSVPFSMNPEEAVTLSQKLRKITEDQARSGEEE